MSTPTSNYGFPKPDGDEQVTRSSYNAVLDDIDLAIKGVDDEVKAIPVVPAQAGNADTLDGNHAGNASGNIPISNGAVNANLNADMLDGKHIDDLVTLASMPSSLGDSGWQKLPSGFMVQWARALVYCGVGGTFVIPTFPLAFPNRFCFCTAYLSPSDHIAGVYVGTIELWSQSSVRVYVYNNNSPAQNILVSVKGIGY